MRNLKVLTTAALASLLTSFAVSAVVAQTTFPTNPDPMTIPSGSIIGQITQISGESVTIRLPNGNTTTIQVPSNEITRLALRAGSNISYVLGSSGIASSIAIAQATSPTTPNPMTSPNGAIIGQITQIAGESITIRLPNGNTTTIQVPSNEITRLGLRAGSNVSYVLGSSGIANSIAIVSSSSMTSTTTSTTTTTTRPVAPATIPTPRPLPVVTNNTPAPVPMASPVTPRAPRALW